MITLTGGGVMLEHGVDYAIVDCPACGEWRLDDSVCECGYCPHPGVIEGVCPLCDAQVEPTMPALVAELLDAADEVLTKLAVYPALTTELATHPALLFTLTNAVPTIAGPVSRLRAIVTQLQGTAGLRVVGGAE